MSVLRCLVLQFVACSTVVIASINIKCHILIPICVLHTLTLKHTRTQSHWALEWRHAWVKTGESQHPDYLVRFAVRFSQFFLLSLRLFVVHSFAIRHSSCIFIFIRLTTTFTLHRNLQTTTETPSVRYYGGQRRNQNLFTYHKRSRNISYLLLYGTTSSHHYVLCLYVGYTHWRLLVEHYLRRWSAQKEQTVRYCS